MLLNYRQCQSLLIGLVSFSGLIAGNLTQAQSIISDESLPTQVQISESENSPVSFSAIDNLIEAGENANELLIHPNEIVFDRNASLDIDSSFLATTTNEISSIEGTFLGTIMTQTAPPILTVGIPIERQLVKTSGFICARSQADFTSFEIKPDNSLALLNDEILLTQSTIDVSKGKLGLGNLVSLNSFRQEVNIEYGGIQITSIDGDSKPTTSELTTRSSNSGCSFLYYIKCQDCSRDGGIPLAPPGTPSCVCQFC